MRVRVNRFPQLVRAVEETADRTRAQDISGAGMRLIGRDLHPVMKEFSPKATKETFYTTGHDHTTIYDGWSPPIVDPGGDGAVLRLMNRSEHIDVQRTGTEKRGYKIPSNPTGVGFWLGSPLKWGRRIPGPPGFVRFAQITHPGFSPWGGRDFVASAAEEMAGETRSTMESTARTIAFRKLEEFFRG